LDRKITNINFQNWFFDDTTIFQKESFKNINYFKLQFGNLLFNCNVSSTPHLSALGIYGLTPKGPKGPKSPWGTLEISGRLV